MFQNRYPGKFALFLHFYIGKVCLTLKNCKNVSHHSMELQTALLSTSRSFNQVSVFHNLVMLDAVKSCFVQCQPTFQSHLHGQLSLCSRQSNLVGKITDGRNDPLTKCHITFLKSLALYSEAAA